MKPEQRKKELIQGLKATANDVVYVNINHVAEVIGIEAAIEAHNEGTLVETTEATRIKRNGDGTREVQRTLVGGLAEWDRVRLLEALEGHKVDEETSVDDQKGFQSLPPSDQQAREEAAKTKDVKGIFGSSKLDASESGKPTLESSDTKVDK